MNRIWRLLKFKSGNAMMEYCIIAVTLSVASMAAVQAIQTSMGARYQTIQDSQLIGGTTQGVDTEGEG